MANEEPGEVWPWGGWRRGYWEEGRGLSQVRENRRGSGCRGRGNTAEEPEEEEGEVEWQGEELEGWK